MNLILFSGGVESTALLTKASSNDLALVIKPVYHNDLETFKQSNIDKIAKYFNIKIAYIDIKLPEIGIQKFSHQMNNFISVCNIIVSRTQDIKEIWCGRNSSEPSGDIKDFIESNMQAWKLLHPSVPFNHPLDHLSKREQWELIPQDIRPLVSSCIYHNFCGRCYKCKEWLCLSESSPKNM